MASFRFLTGEADRGVGRDRASDPSDYIYGYGGDDTLIGGLGGDHLFGGDGNDFLFSSKILTLGPGYEAYTFENDYLYGGYGNDSLVGWGSTSVMYGGKGDNSYYVDENDTITEFEDGGTDFVVFHYRQTVSPLVYYIPNNVEIFSLILTERKITSMNYVQGNDGKEQINGSPYGDILAGGGGNDKLFGGRGNDILWGEDGNDRIDGGKGGDEMSGGAGHDTYIVDSTRDKVIETETDNSVDRVISSVDFRLPKNVEVLILTGNSAPYGYGSYGIGNELNNVIFGDNANNTLIGGDGDDTIIGWGGRDTIIGGRGSDTMAGGGGDQGTSDTFLFLEFEAGAVDTIGNFERVGPYADVVDFRRLDADPDARGIQGFAFVPAGHTPNSQAPYMTVTDQRDGDTAVTFSRFANDGSREQHVVILDDGPDTTASDYLASDFLV